MFFTSPQKPSPVPHDDNRVIFGKTLLVPDFDQGPSPTDIWSRDMLPRLSMRPNPKVVMMAAATVKETDGYLQLDSHFRLPQKQPEHEEKKPQQHKPDEEDEFIKTIAKRRGWGDQLPTTNPHVMHALLKEPAAFKRFPLTATSTGMQIAQQVNLLIYTNPKFIQPLAPQSGDVVVLGLPRSGQTCVLRILDMLQTRTATSPNTRLLENTVWHENGNGTVSNAQQQQQRRIVKSHLPIHQAIVPTTTASGAPARFIIVLRHPGDLRLSMYRHVRRVYTKCTNTALQQFDDVVRREEFAGEIPGLVETPEVYTANALRAVQSASQHSNNVLIVFYEEVLAHPLDLVHRIAHFTNYMRPSGEDPFATSKQRGGGKTITTFASAQDETMVRQITEAITAKDDQHPINLKRIGSSGQASVCLSERDLLVQRKQWTDEQTMKQFAEYDALYAAVTGKPYLFSNANTEVKVSKKVAFRSGVKQGSLQSPRRRFGSLIDLFTTSNTAAVARQRRNTDLSALQEDNDEEEEISYKPNRAAFKHCNDSDDNVAVEDAEMEMDFEF